MPRIAEADRPARRRRLIDAAWRCLARGSYANLRVEDVCAEAGLSKGSFYGYFETKRELFYTLVEEDSLLLEDAAADGPDPRGGTSARLLRFARASLRAAEDPARVQLRADIWAAASNDETLEDRLREANARRRVMLRGWIEDAVGDGSLIDVPAHALAALMIALVDGLALHRRLDPGAYRSENAHRALEILLTGLAQSPASLSDHDSTPDATGAHVSASSPPQFEERTARLNEWRAAA